MSAEGSKRDTSLQHRAPVEGAAGKSGASRDFPLSAGILLGLGLGGFFAGIVFHQILQWHHMATSAGFPADTLEGLRWNTVLDGLFHGSVAKRLALQTRIPLLVLEH